jgi:hypothetical protein
MFAMTELEMGFGRESRSITPGIGVLVLIVCVGLMLWIAGALGRDPARRSAAGEED